MRDDLAKEIAAWVISQGRRWKSDGASSMRDTPSRIYPDGESLGLNASRDAHGKPPDLVMLLDNSVVGVLLFIPFYLVILWKGCSLFRDSSGMWCAIGLLLRVSVERSHILALLSSADSPGADSPGSVGDTLWPRVT